jgi:cellulase/cellobiase CelA1
MKPLRIRASLAGVVISALAATVMSVGPAQAASAPVPTPYTPFVSNITTVGAELTSGVGLNNSAAGYVAQELVNGVWTDTNTSSTGQIALYPLTPATTYTFAVVALDANGDRSARSGSVTFTTRQLQPAPSCEVDAQVFGQEYILQITVENFTASTVLGNWVVTFTNHQVIGSLSSSQLTMNGDQSTVTPAAWNKTINPGGEVMLVGYGFIPAGTAVPSGFVLDGTTPCTSA